MRLIRPTALSITLATGLALALPFAAMATTKSSAESASKASAGKASSKASSKAAGKGAKTTTSDASSSTKASARPAMVLTEAQMVMANQVLTGRADCEFKQFVVVERVAADAGAFRVKHRGSTYTMVPEETTTGAVRLVDRKTGVVWIQIPVKSMLLNQRAGSRIIDACAGPAQRQAQAQAEAAERAAAADPQQGVPPSMLGRQDSIPAGMMNPTPTNAATPSAYPAASAPLTPSSLPGKL